MSRTNFKFDFSASSSSFHCRRSLGLSRHFRNIIDKRFDDRASLARSLEGNEKAWAEGGGRRPLEIAR